MKKIYFLLASAAIAAASVFAVAPQLTDTVNAPARKPADTARIKASGPARVKGGADGNKQLYGYVESSSYGVLDGWSGVAAINVNGNHTKVSSKLPEPYSGCYFTKDGHGYLLGVEYGQSTVNYTVYDTSTWSGTKWQYTLTTPNVNSYDLAFDPETRRVYGCFLNTTSSIEYTDGIKLGYLDICSADFNLLDAFVYVGDLSVAMRGISFNSEGQLYGIGYDNKLYKINKLTAALTEVCSLSWPSGPFTNPSAPGYFKGHESAEFDWDNDELYFSGNDANWDTFIAKVDTQTGAVTFIADFGYETGGTESTEIFPVIFFMQAPKTSATAPAAVGNLTATAVGTELKVDVAFDLPTLDTEGATLTGNVDWAITDGTNTLDSGSATPGEHISRQVAISAEGFADIVVTPSQNGVNGAATFARPFVGNDTPTMWGVPDVVPDDNNGATISWNEAYAPNGGNLAPVTYRVVRQPGDVVVAESTSAVSLTDHLDSNDKTRCYYEITPTSGGKTGNPATSRPTYIGSVFSFPHTDVFDDEVLFNQYPAIDGNNDGSTWWIDVSKKRAVYSGTNIAADDYLCIGPFSMVAGNDYTFNITADAHSTLENFAVYAGTDPESASSFTNEVIPVTTINPTVGYAIKEGSFTPAASGLYYFAIHACSEADRSNIYVYNIRVSGVSATMPAAPDVSYKATATGAILTYTLPAKTLGGDEAANVTSARIYRDNTLIAEVTENIADGATLSYEDTPTPLESGQHTYTVAAVNSHGEGQPTTIDVYLGPDQPGQPYGMSVYEDLDTPGLMHVSWKAPETGANGGYINPSALVYTVDWLSYTSSISGEQYVGQKTSLDLQLPKDKLDKQGVIAFTVTAQNTNGSAGSRSSETRSAYFGPAFTLPLCESWADGKDHIGSWAGEATVDNPKIFESYWDIATGASQDADSYMMYLATTVPDGGYRLRSPRVTLSGTNDPTLVFYLRYTADIRDFTVEVAVDDQPMTALQEIDIIPANAGEWHRVEIPLSRFKDNKYIQFGFTGHATVAAENFAAIDNVNILDKVDHNLLVISFDGPDKVEVNSPAQLNLVIRNSGAIAAGADDYTVKLIKNGVEIDSRPGTDIDSYENATFSFTDYPLPTDLEQTVYTAVIDYPADQNPTDNSSAEVTVRLSHTEYPAPTGLTGRYVVDGISLSWTEPDMNSAPGQSVTETFDTYEAFLTSGFGDWTTYDRDGCPTVIMSTLLGPYNYPHVGEPMAWQVFDPNVPMIFDGAWYARSGEQMLVSFQACYNGGREIDSDDWLVSPELDGTEQTVSFYARAGAKSYAPELLDIYVSSTGIEADDFTILATNVEVNYTSDWVEYFYTLPAGTKHFAIVHKSYAKLAVLIDDITYIPEGSQPESITLTGYHVYRDGARLTTLPVEEATYLDTDIEYGKEYTYHVTAVYDKGESVTSNAASVTAGIDDVRAMADVTVSAKDRIITVKGAEGLPIAVYTTSGQTVASVSGSSLTEIPVPATGIYIVRAGQTTVKLIVR